MALNLKIPALSDKPLIIAETRPQKIKQFLEELPASNTFEAATLLLEEMEILNRQKISSSNRFKALETYRPKVTELCEILSAEYCNTHLPLSEKAKTHASLTESLWLELGYGYKLSLIDFHNRLFSIDSSKSTALILHRAIESIGALAIVYYHTYVTLPKSLWSDLYQLFSYGYQEAVNEVEIKIDADITDTVTSAFKRVVLMSLTNPKHLSPRAIQLVAEYINAFADLSSISSANPAENTPGYFLIRLNSEDAPFAFINNQNSLDLANDKFLSVIELVKLTHKNAKLLDSGEKSNLKTLPASASEPYYVDVLKDLVKHLGSSKKRVFNRAAKTGGLELGVGVSAAHHFIHSDAESAAKNEHAHADETLKYRTSRWQYTNISAGGMGLRKFQNVDAKIRVGDLVSVRGSASNGWSLGILRWANSSEKNLDIGTQLIAPQATAVEARPINEENYEPVLLLPELPALNQASSIISSCGIYSPARIMELKEAEKVSRIMITKLIERTSSFERFQFSYLQAQI